MVVVFADRPAAIVPTAGRDVDLAAEDRPHAALAGVVVERDRREHVAVLGDRHRRHAKRFDLIQQLIDPASAVEQRVFGVQVKVDEIGHRIEGYGRTSGARR